MKFEFTIEKKMRYNFMKKDIENLFEYNVEKKKKKTFNKNRDPKRQLFIFLYYVYCVQFYIRLRSKSSLDER
jgi:hypothetical protein